MILITGGAGYIGSHVNRLLSSIGYKTIIVDRKLKWDIRDRHYMDWLFGEFEIDTVMHLAAYINAGESVFNPYKYYSNNVNGTLSLLNSMSKHGVNKIIFSSSCAVYGIPSSERIDEQHKKNPINPYGMTKLMCENILQDFSNAHGIKYITLRYFNAAGADPSAEIGECHDTETHLIPLVLQSCFKENQSVDIYGTDYDTPDGTCVRDYIHVNDIANAHVLALEYLSSHGVNDDFNLSNDCGFSVRDIISSAERVTGKSIKTNEKPRRAGDPPYLVGNSDKARTVLNWLPKYTSIDDIIATAWKWHSKRGV